MLPKQHHGIDDVMDIPINKRGSTSSIGSIKDMDCKRSLNIDRTVGAYAFGQVSKRYGEDSLPRNTINCTFRGSAGQNFGAFLAKGLAYVGDANDYLGKRIFRAVKLWLFLLQDLPLIEGMLLVAAYYDFHRGHAYKCSVAGERFAVRNSGP